MEFNLDDETQEPDDRGNSRGPANRVAQETKLKLVDPPTGATNKTDEARQKMAITFLIGLLTGFLLFVVLKKRYGGKK